MTIDVQEHRCTGDENGWCGQPAFYEVTLHPPIGGQRFACEKCSASKEVQSKRPIGEFFAEMLGPRGEEILQEEQRRARAMLDAEMARRGW